jgi:hypothetical protein
MSVTNFPNGVSSFGVQLPSGGIPATKGRYIFTDYGSGSDGNDGLSPATAVKTIAQAYSMTTTNMDDVIVLCGSASHVLTSMLTVSKNRVHFVGMDGSNGRRYGQNAKIYMGVTTAITDVHAIKNLGVRNSFTNIKFYDDNTLATYHTSCVGEGGEYAIYENCEFYASVNLTSNTFAELLLNGDSTQFYNCTFGSLADAVSGDKVRPAVIFTAGGVLNGTGTSRDIFFDGCRFWKQAGGTTTAMVVFPSDSSMERLCEFHDCQFIAAHLGSTPAVAIACTATMTNGQILLTGDTSCVHCTKLATATGVISCLNAKVAATQIGIQIAG